MAVIATPRQAATIRFHAAPVGVRSAFGLLERSAPALGARWAERIWFTLPRDRLASRCQHIPGGVPFRLTVNGTTIEGTTWGEGPAVYLVHGWAGHHGDLAAFVPSLVARGYRAVAYDAPSHGGSAPGVFGPHSSSLPEFVDTLAAVVATHGPGRAVIAHSMGATAAAVGDGVRAGRLVLLAPMASVVTYARQFASALGFGPRTYHHLLGRVERRVGAPLDLFEVPAVGRAAIVPPTLIVHDRDDAVIPVTHGTAIATAWAGSRLTVTSGLGHRRLLRDPDVVAEVVDFIHT